MCFNKLLVLQRFEERIDSVFHLRLGEVARILEVRLNEQRRDTKLLREVLPHVSLTRGEETAALDRMDHQGVSRPLLNVAPKLRVALEEVPIRDVPLEHVLGGGLGGRVRVMPGPKLPYPAHH